MIQIFINNSKYNFDKNLTILQALEKLNIEVPKFCYNDRLSVAGNCRMCLVEVEKSPKPVVSCATPITEGVSIYTDTPLVKKARESVLEFLLVNHPLDCPICDQGGECDLQDQTKGFGSDRNRSFKYNKRGVQDKDVGPIIKTIMTRCIHCTRCVRFVTEITGKASLGTFGRGRSTEIGTYINDFIKTELSGNLVDLCPVGALTSKPYAFMARSWELKKTETIDLFDAIGSNIVAGARNVSKSETLKMQSYENSREKIMRILPKFNEDLNEAWISDKSRYAFDGIYVHRTLEPLFINNSFNKIHSNTNWNFILNKISSDISNNIIFGISNKDFNKINNVKLEYQNLKKVSSKFDLIWSNSFKTDFISKKMYSQFILNKFYKTKLIKGHVENIDTLDSTLNFVYFLKTIGINAISTNSYNKISNNDIAYYFTFNTSLKNVEKSKIIILIDINPRKEASVFNIRLSKYLSKNNVTLYNFGIASDLYYKYNHKGSSLKNFINFLEGRDLLCVKSRNVNQISVICGTEYLTRTSGDSLQNAIKTLNAKLYLNSKVTKGFNLLSSSINDLYDYELNISNSYKYNFTTKNADLFLIKGHSFKENNKLLKSKEIIYYATHNNEYIQKGLTSVVLPITTHFEKNGIVLNVEGLLQKNYKVINAPSNIIKNTEDINESILILNSLKKSYLNNNLSSYELFTKNNNKMLNYYYNSKLLNQFYYKLKFYKNYEFKRIYLGSFKEKIHNFYMSDIISKNSSVMSMCTLFNVQKNNYQLLIN